jgi:hypothetical protein
VPYALNDPAAALSWVSQFQGQEFYDAALGGVLIASAQVDPRRAAELLSLASAEVQAGTAPQVFQIWANDDASAAERWTLDLERGETRDAALNALIARHAMSGDFDRSLLDAFSSDPARQDALQRVIPMLSRTNPDAAEALLGR